jgi:hypothetical protein
MPNFNNFQAQTGSVAGLKKWGFQTAQPEKRCAQGFSAFDTE